LVFARRAKTSLQKKKSTALPQANDKFGISTNVAQNRLQSAHADLNDRSTFQRKRARLTLNSKPSTTPVYPFTSIVGQAELKLALL
jgi:hypothetical protein